MVSRTLGIVISPSTSPSGGTDGAGFGPSCGTVGVVTADPGAVVVDGPMIGSSGFAWWSSFSNVLLRLSWARAVKIPVPQSWYTTNSRISIPRVTSVRPMPAMARRTGPMVPPVSRPSRAVVGPFRTIRRRVGEPSRCTASRVGAPATSRRIAVATRINVPTVRRLWAKPATGRRRPVRSIYRPVRKLPVVPHPRSTELWLRCVRIRAAVYVLGRYPALAGDNLEVASGEVLFLSGPNGAGNRTL